MSFNKLTQNKILLPLILLLSPILFKTLFIQILNNRIINPFVSKIEDDEFLFSFFLLALGLVIWDFCIKLKNSFRIELYSIFLLSLIPTFYLYFRISKSWIFYPEGYTIAYLDIILVYWFMSLILYLICILNDKKTDTTKTFFDLDKPVQRIEDDKYGRRSFAESLAKSLIKTKEVDNAFTVGVIGKWGSGKTSFLNLIEKYLPQNNKKIIIIKFNPWLFDSKSSLNDDFFSKLKNKLKPFSFELTTQITQYAERLTSLDSNLLTRFFKVGIGSLYKEKSTDELFDSINETIKSQDLHIVVFIDDLDRLDHDETVEIIKLIRNTANFSYTTFIVSFDKDYLINALETKNYHNPEGFLEKIFQLEIPLPKVEYPIEDSYIHDKISNEIIQEDQKEYHVYFDKGFVIQLGKPINLIETIREAKRFINSFLISYNNLKGEVDVVDLINLEILKVKYPEIYFLLQNDSKDNIIHRGLDIYNLSATYLFDKKSIENLNQEKKNREYDKKEFQEIISILSSLFIGNHSPKSIAFPSNFDKYFSFNLLKNGFQEKWFSQVRKIENQQELNKKLDEFCKGNSEHRLFDRFSRMNNPSHFSDKKEFEKLAKSLSYIENKFPGYSRKGYLYSFILSGENLYKDSKEFEDFLKRLLSKPYKPPYSETSLIKALIQSNFNDKWLGSMLSNYIDNITNESDKFELIALNQYKILHEFHSNKDHPEIIDSKDSILESINKDPVGFFSWSLIPVSFKNDEYRIHDSFAIRILFSNLKGYLEYYNNLDFPESEIPYKQELVQFLEKYVDYGLPEVPFKFEKFELKQ